MKVYFYCSYEHSKRGFFPVVAELADRDDCRIFAADGIHGEEMPVEVNDFFSYDRFRILWRDYGGKEDGIFRPSPEKTLFGIRDLTGKVSDRSVIINLAFFSEMPDKEGVITVKDAVYAVMNAYSEFVKKIFEWFTIGGEHGYEIDCSGMYEWLLKKKKTVEKKKDERKLADYTEGITWTERNLLHFAVIKTGWQEIASCMGNKLLWKVKPARVIEEEEFEREINRGENQDASWLL